MHDNEDKETSTDEVKTDYKRTQKKFLLVRDFPHSSKLALRTTQLPVKRVPGLFAGDKVARAWS